MAELYVPIHTSDVWNVIPQGEDIIYSTPARVELMSGQILHKYNTHLLITSNGIAFKKANFTKFNLLSKGTSDNFYAPWEHVPGIVSMGKFGTGFRIYDCSIFLKQLEDNETKKQFKAREKLFVAKFRPLLIKKHEIFLKELLKDPIKNKKMIKGRQRILRMLKKKEEKRLRKEK